MTDTTELEDRLAATLKAKAAQLTVHDEPFIPGTVGSVTSLADRRRPGRRVWVLVAAIAAVVVLVAGAALVGTVHHQSTVNQVDRPDRPYVLAPTWVPDGYQLWDVSPSSGPGAVSPAGGPLSIQLFADQAGPVLYVQVGHGARTPSASGDPVTVRGQAGTEVPATTGSGVGSTRPSGDLTSVADSPLTIHWTEDGQLVTAMAVRLSPVEMVALLDAMAWQSPGDPLSGVDESSLSSAAHPLNEIASTVDQSVPAAARTTFVYFRGAPTIGARSGITVAIGGPGSSREGYYQARLSHPVQADGSIESTGTMPESTTAVASVLWPDGSSASALGDGIDPAELLHVAGSAVPTTDADLDARRAEITDRILALPVVATAELTPLTLEVHGDGGTALCAHAGSGLVTCGAVAGAGTDERAGVAVGVVVDGDWYVGAAGTTPFSFTSVYNQSLNPSTPMATTVDDLPVVHTIDQAPWHFLVAAMPASSTAAAVDWDVTGGPTCPVPAGGDCGVGVSLSRPPG